MSRRFVTIEGQTVDAISDLVREFGVDVVRHTLRMENDRLTVDAIIEPGMLGCLTRAGYVVHLHADAGESPQPPVAHPRTGGRQFP